jgi:DNA sulfur modification protein DndB
MPIRLTLPRIPRVDRKSIDEADRRSFLKRGYTESTNRRFGRIVMVKRLRPWEVFEEEVRRFCKHSLELADVDGGYGFRIGDYQIDAVGGISDHLVLFECKSSGDPKKSLRLLIRDMRDRRASYLAAIRRQYNGRYRHITLVVVLRGHIVSPSDQNYADENGIALWTEAYWESVRALYLIIGSRVKYYILKELGGQPPTIPGSRRSYFEFPAIRTKMENIDLFALFIPASVLLEIAYVLRPESGQESAYQRFLDKGRLKKIATFLEAGKSFKNSIVLALSSESTFRQARGTRGGDSTQRVSTGTLTIPRRYVSAWVIDGQHRLYGFVRVQSDRLLNETLPVVAMKSKSTAEEAETFLDINSNQKPVDPSRIWALFGTLDPASQKGTISRLVQHLAQDKGGPFFGRVYVPGGSRSRRNYRIYHSNLCGTIADHLVAGRKRGYALLLTDSAPVQRRLKAEANARRVISRYFATLIAWANSARRGGGLTGFSSRITVRT